MDNYVDKVVDKKIVKYSTDLVSPYLRRPLRSLADALADRARPAAQAPALGAAAPANDDSQPPARPSLTRGG